MRADDKKREIEEYLKELSTIVPKDAEEYGRDFKSRAACERYLEKIIEAIVDLAFLTIKTYNLRIPEEDKEAFDILAENKFITRKLADKLKEARGMRNIIAHEYGRIDDSIVFNSIKEELFDDVKDFLNSLFNNF